MHVVPDAIWPCTGVVLESDADVDLVMVVLSGLDQFRSILFERWC
jgi:hypothetical protein